MNIPVGRRLIHAHATRTLAELFEKGPATFLPGTKMPLQRIPDREALDSLIAYLKIITEAETSDEASQD